MWNPSFEEKENEEEEKEASGFGKWLFYTVKSSLAQECDWVRGMSIQCKKKSIVSFVSKTLALQSFTVSHAT